MIAPAAVITRPVVGSALSDRARVVAGGTRCSRRALPAN